MRPGSLSFAFLIPLAAAAACAQGAELPSESHDSIVQTDAGDGIEAGNIRGEAGLSTPTPVPDAGPEASPEASAPEPPELPAIPQTSGACADDPTYGLFLIALALSGTTPIECESGACESGMCCYQGQFCLPE